MASKAKKIAALTGLSLPTIWHILGNKGHLYKPQTRQKVLDAAEKLGYRPNMSARAMSTGKFGCVALLLSSSTDRSSLPPSVLHGINDALLKRDMHLTLFQTPDHTLLENGFVPKILTQSMADGLLINYTHWMPEPVKKRLTAAKIPTIWINTDRPHDCVRPDDVRAGYDATRRLIELGHERIAYLKYFPSEHYSVAGRGKGYAKAMKEAGLRPRVIDDQVSHSEFKALAARVLKGKDRPTAAVAYGDTAAFAFSTAALELGMRIPDDLSLATFAGRPVDTTGTAYDTWVIPEHEIGAAAVEMLLEKIDAPKKKIPARAFAFTYHAGESCAAPRA